MTYEPVTRVCRDNAPNAHASVGTGYDAVYYFNAQSRCENTGLEICHADTLQAMAGANTIAGLLSLPVPAYWAGRGPGARLPSMFANGFGLNIFELNTRTITTIVSDAYHMQMHGAYCCEARTE